MTAGSGGLSNLAPGCSEVEAGLAEIGGHGLALQAESRRRRCYNKVLSLRNQEWPCSQRG